MADLFVAPENKPHQKTLMACDPLTAHSHSGIGAFSSFLHNPKHITFQNQEEGENVVLLIRRHFITNLSWLLISVVLLLIAPIIATLAQSFNFTLLSLPTTYILVLLLFYYLIVFGYMFINFFSWFYNIGIVTNQRIIDVDSPSILSKSVASTALSDVVDAEYSQHGFRAGFFNYGDIFVQTEGIKSNFEYFASPQPAKAVDIILDLKPNE